MLRLSLQQKYAIRALVVIAGKGRKTRVQSRQIAEREGIPRKFLEQILADLREAGLVLSARGKDGGYTLDRSAGEIRLRDIIEAFDGPLSLLPCLKPDDPAPCPDCQGTDECWIRGALAETSELAVALLDRVTLADLCRRAESVKHATADAFIYQI